ncbi:MAG: carbonic anhydrase [Chitinophagaceae bacterium]|nr:MAG: carbonic anhydrase [Chitinophagaceae bacterium]
MRDIFKGAKAFQEIEYPKRKKVFDKIKINQKPHTLFIGCSDSRISPDMITQSLPGELFVVRNIANIVPHYDINEAFLATTSAIEYAVEVLNVKNIIVCGHSKCGGCKAMHSGQNLDHLPHVKKWIEMSCHNSQQVDFGDKFSADSKVELNNVIEQLDKLKTYPFINEKIEEKKLKIFGWYYDIGEGSVYNYDKEEKVFKRI